MRALRVVGLHEDGKSIVCEDPASRTRFLLPADERLRAAARGDITRLGQIEIELESQMRPREIQARIRSGESVDQVATSAGVSVQRVERFAYPVLLERSRTAEIAQSAHPVREDGPDVQTLGEVVAYTFGARGQDYSQATWDAWRGDDGKWVIGLRWKAGRSDNRAHWAFAPGAHGGTVTALDEHGEDLLDPDAQHTRTLRSVAQRTVGTQQTLDAIEDEPVRGTLDGAGGRVIEARIPGHDGEDDTRELPRIQDEEPGRPALGRNGHPIVPSWEDVLLGVRSQRANGS
ncbi:DNA-binding protein [Amycolatopsis antarctica]|uniref:DNA-binding protein n=1 Tax=Amycolatopsis antarctica TaxID=1854586 RepID=A0A263CZP3_9PSEU|nr:septation protein SepH [Amycolatopsis antarctica]OZM70575.1 DNA-binding protein [Amycolatopsis antarctica]